MARISMIETIKSDNVLVDLLAEHKGILLGELQSGTARKCCGFGKPNCGYATTH